MPDDKLRIETLSGAAVRDALPALAGLRIRVFRDWPYLYDGTLDYERDYLQGFAATKDSVIVAAYDGETIVGVATASPMAAHADDFGKPLLARGIDISRIFYFGESVLLPAYRGRGTGHAFFDHREAHARALGGYEHAAFCAVIRPDDHPLRPADYRPLDGFWSKRGYGPIDGLIAHFSWTDVGQSAKTEKPMQVWMKSLT